MCNVVNVIAALRGLIRTLHDLLARSTLFSTLICVRVGVLSTKFIINKIDVEHFPPRNLIKNSRFSTEEKTLNSIAFRHCIRTYLMAPSLWLVMRTLFTSITSEPSNWRV